MEVDPPQPPPDRRMPGRPAKNRRKEEGKISSGHTKMSRKGRKMTYQVCYQIGHNKQTCKSLRQAQQAENEVPEASIGNTEVANDQFYHPQASTRHTEAASQSSFVQPPDHAASQSSPIQPLSSPYAQPEASFIDQMPCKSVIEANVDQNSILKVPNHQKNL